MATTNKIRFGIIGVGHMGSYHLNVAAALPTHEIVGIFDARPEHAAEKAALFNTKAFASYQQLIDVCEAVTIAVSGEGFSVAQAGEALEPGPVGAWIRVRTAQGGSQGNPPAIRARVVRPGLVNVDIGNGLP